MSHIQFNMPSEVRKELKKLALEYNITMADVLRLKFIKDFELKEKK